VTEQGENAVRGDITVYGSAQTIDDVLDPDYDPADFESRWSCAERLAQPLSTECGASNVLASGSAALVLRSFGVIAKLVEEDSACGFSNVDVKSRVTVTGEVGRDGAVATFGIAQPCPIQIPDELLLSTDCSGVETKVQGIVEVTGTKTISGYNTGNVDTPIVPTSRDAVKFDLVAQINGFKVSVTDQPTLVIDDGLLTGNVGVRTAQDAETGACSRATPAVTFGNVAFGGVMSIVSNDVSVAVETELVDVNAQNGVGPTSENSLIGEVEIDGVDVALDGELNPDYDAVDFQSGFICEENLLIPLDDATCTFRGPLGQLTARNIMTLIDAALHCCAGPAPATCSSECVYADELVASDCTTETRATGGVTVNATRTENTFAIESMTLENFVAGDSVLTFNGEVTGGVEIVVDNGVETPGRKYAGISVAGDGTIELEGLTFHFTVDASELNGERGGTNELTGSITIDGQAIEIPVDRRDRTLEPEFDQAAFEARYSCQ
jgi:hypothetical protein